jgi:hypothetical protein
LVLIGALLLLAVSGTAAQGTPYITIVTPSIGANLPNAATAGVEVTGNAGFLVDVITVQALDASNQVVAETTTNSPQGEGSWAAFFVVSYVGPGRIVAVSGDPSTQSVLATAGISVTFGQQAVQLPATLPPTAAPAPWITITSPAIGAVLPNAAGGVQITGNAGFLTDVITVQALNSSNQVVAQTTTNNPQGQGPWAAFLAVPFAGAGRIVAFSGNTNAGISVTFGQQVPPALPPSVIITNPPNNGIANAANGSLTVSGTSANIFENNVVVQVRDSFGRTMQQTATTANASGNWSTTIAYLVANSSTGSIRAFSPSAIDGSAVAESVVNVTFSSSCTVRTDWPIYTVQSGDSLLTIAIATGSTTTELTIANCLPNPSLIFSGQQLRVPRLPSAIPPVAPALTITSPGTNTSVNATGSILVSGQTAGAAVGNTSVRLIGSLGTVLTEAPVIVTNDPQDGTWQWEIALNAAQIPAGTDLIVYAYAVNPANSQVLISASSNIVYGTRAANQPFITITSPQPYTQLSSAARGITITGRGGNLNDVITVQALNDAGGILAQTTTNNPQGADGEWAATLVVPETRRGRIVAYSGNAATQSVDVVATIDVIFGDPAQNATFVLLSYPLPGTIISPADPYVSVAGTARGVFSNLVIVNVLDEFGNIILSGPATVNATNGTWSLTSTANTRIQAHRTLNLQVIATTPDGGVLAADRINVVTQP